MERLNKIFEHLNISCVVFIENDFNEISIDLVLAKYVTFSNKAKLLDKFTLLGHQDFVEKLNLFDSIFNKLPHLPGMKDYLQSGIRGYVEMFKENLGILDIVDDIERNATEEIQKTFFKYGFLSYPQAYNSFFENMLSGRLKQPVLCYKIIVANEIPSFKEDLLSVMDEKKTFVSIIDNQLQDANDGSGVLIAKRDIKAMLDHDSTITGYSVIFTSQNPPNEADELENGYYQIVLKSNDSILDISKALSLIAYTKTFSYLHKKTQKAIADIPNIIKEQKHNIAYIVDKANIEGMLPYEAIHIWYENAINYLVNKSYQEEVRPIFTSTIGLSKLFDKEFLESNDNPSFNFEEIVANEIFDFSVNAKHLPIAPGDVFWKNENDFVVLVGQSCDLAIRSNCRRGASIAELLKSKFATKEEVLKCYSQIAKGVSSKEKKQQEFIRNSINKKINRGEDFLLFNKFRHNNNLGYLKIEHKTKSVILVDFSILDLCIYNNDGKCSINLNAPLPQPLIRYFTDANVNNYSALQEKMRSLAEINNPLKDSLKDKTCELLSYTKEDDVVTFPFQRICRIKGNFNQLIHHNYWHYRSRTDLNEINLTEE